jgi:hypothetical protein
MRVFWLPVLDELRDVVPVDDVARGDGEVDAHGEPPPADVHTGA